MITFLVFALGIVCGLFLYPIWMDNNKPPTPEI